MIALRFKKPTSLVLAAVAGLCAPALAAGAAAQEAPIPLPPAVIARDGQGHATVRAVHLDTPITVNGRLDDEVYQTVPSIGDFIQSLPHEGEPATERTEAWVMFDDTNIYVSARCWDSAPPSEWVANEMRRDTNQLRQNDTFGVMFDTFNDHRNGFVFYTNPLGAARRFCVYG